MHAFRTEIRRATRAGSGPLVLAASVALRDAMAPERSSSAPAIPNRHKPEVRMLFQTDPRLWRSGRTLFLLVAFRGVLNLDGPGPPRLGRRSLHRDFEHSVAERSLGAFGDDTFRQRDRPVELAVLPLAVVIAFPLFFVFRVALPAKRQ